MTICIFDLDGTLLNTIADLGCACNYALQKNGFPTHNAEDYPHLVGNGVNKLIERALPEGHKDEATILRLRQDFVNYYDAHNRDKTLPYEGIKEVITKLKQQGFLLAVASNKYQAATETIVHHYFGADTFDVVFGERPGCPRKPDPQIVIDIISKVSHHQIDKVIYIGDSDVDMLTAHNASAMLSPLPIVSIACTWGFCNEQTLIDNNPDYVVHRPIELRGLMIDD